MEVNEEGCSEPSPSSSTSKMEDQEEEALSIAISKINIEKDNDNCSDSPAVFKVLGCTTLLEKILGHVIFDEEPRSEENRPVSLRNKEDIKSLRLVHSSWLQAVSDIIRLKDGIDAGAVFYKLECKRLGYDKDDEQVALIERPERFIGSMTSGYPTPTWPRISVSQLPFHLALRAHFFVPENHPSLIDLLTKCSSGLVSLKVEFPANIPGVPKTYPQIHLPRLEHLEVYFSDHKVAGIREPFQCFAGEDLQTKFIQLLFDQSEKLTTLKFATNDFCCLKWDNMYMPSATGDLKLPKCLQELTFDFKRGPMKTTDLERLMRQNHLPNISTLKVHAYDLVLHEGQRRPKETMLKKGFIYKMLSPFQHSLQHLHLTRKREIFGSTIYYKLPPLDNLATFRVETLWSMEPHADNDPIPNSDRLDIKLPKLDTLELLQPVTELNKWARYPQQFYSVRNLTLKMFIPNGELVGYDAGIQVSLNRRQMEAVHWAFPNVVNLSITIRGIEAEGIRAIFRGMIQLRTLTISMDDLQYPGIDRAGHPMNWDAVFVGCSEVTAVQLKTEGQQEQAVCTMMAQDVNEFPSIRNLKSKYYLE